MYILAGFAPTGGSLPGSRVLVLEADPASRAGLLALLAERGYAADGCSATAEASARLERGGYAVLIVGSCASLEAGLAVVQRARCERADIGVVLLAAEVETSVLVAALRAGVCDYMTRRFEAALLAEHLLDVLQRSIDSQDRASVWAARSAPSAARDPVREVLIGECTAIEQARREVRRALGRDLPLLIRGEAGTEKLAVARLLHGCSASDQHGFTIVNGAARALDGARAPLWSEPTRTLFFPDVGALDAARQAELLELLSSSVAGSGEPLPRVVAGLGEPASASWEGSALCRCFDSLGAIRVTLPALRERGRDIGVLAEHAAEQVRLERGDASLRITGAALEALVAYGWPGNVDELRLAIQHAASLCTDSTITVADLPPCIALGADGAADESGSPLRVQSLQAMQHAYISRVLLAAGGNKASAARVLGVDRTTLYRKLQRQEDPVAVPEAQARGRLRR